MITFAAAKPIVELLVAMSIGAIVEDSAKLVTPSSMRTFTKFGVRIGSSLLGTVVGGVVATYFTKQLQDIHDITNPPEEDPNTIVVQEKTD